MVNFSEGLESQTAASVLVAITLFTLFLFLSYVLKRDSTGRKLPRGSLGLPVIGESWSFIQANKDDKGAEWINERIVKYGPVFKTSLMGKPTVVVTGLAGNKFIFGTNDAVLPPKQPITISRIAGEHNIFEMSRNRYKLIKGALMSFLKPENLQEYIGVMDDLVKKEVLNEMEGKATIKAVPFMKYLTFNVSCALLFGIHDEPTKQALLEDFFLAFKGVWSIPVSLPGTMFWKALRARSRIIKRMLPIVEKKREMLREGTLNPKSDVISSLVALRDDNGEPITNEEIMDNIIVLMIASHDTTAILLSLIVWKLAREPKLREKVQEEHEDIIRERQGTKGKLTWNEVQKMKYTWRVAQELMRQIPIVFGSFRKAIQNITFAGYDIPKGWQVFWAASPTHMDKDIFVDPDHFDPARFEKPSNTNIPPFAYIPFGGGAHMCIGIEFARIEALTIIHNLVINFEWSQVIPDEKITSQPMPYPSMGLPINLKQRTPFE
ncbi:taxane 13-alpha-hydroxylase-like protein [Cinnamomum micranthum f. kanehirae]|uniref:Taxane 13-alpha-hydroxylase-like protein n=1 Tax=Cinnamomum micranthum f. kanehirae TaxID=337451 RepID=A0A3S3PJX5_9MAGN|nr:taxane 13-alpha-hydroxylase-like protein [Cinnamomum micranthum f. kanehirae]